MKIAYKLVWKNSCDELTSIVAYDGKYSIKYKVGEIIRPKIGKLFVFKDVPTKGQIERITSSQPQALKLYKCVVPALTEAYCISSNHSESSFELFWDGYKTDGLSKIFDFIDNRFKCCIESPIPNTYFADEIVLIEDASHLIVRN